MSTSGWLGGEGYELANMDSDPTPRPLMAFWKNSGSSAVIAAAYAYNSNFGAWLSDHTIHERAKTWAAMALGDAPSWYHDHTRIFGLADDNEWTLWVVGNITSGANQFGIGVVKDNASGNFKIRIWRVDYTSPASPVFTTLATGTTLYAQSTWHHFDFKISISLASSGNDICEVFVNGTTEVTATVAWNDANPILVQDYLSHHQWEVASGKSASIDLYHDNTIQNKDGSQDVFSGRLGSTYYVVGHQFEKDVDATFSVSRVGATGTSTGVTATTMTDSGAAWTVDQFIGQLLSSGGSTAVITSNTATVLTFSGGWTGGTPPTGAYTITAVKRYGHIDDEYEDTHDAGVTADYIYIDKNDLTTIQHLALVDKNASGTVEAIIICGEARREGASPTGVGAAAAGVLCYTSGGTDKSLTWDYESAYGALHSETWYFYDAFALLDGAELITNAIFNTMQLGIRNDIDEDNYNFAVYKFIVQAVGPGVVAASVNTSNINADETGVCPPEGAAQRRRGAIV